MEENNPLDWDSENDFPDFQEKIGMPNGQFAVYGFTAFNEANRPTKKLSESEGMQLRRLLRAVKGSATGVYIDSRQFTCCAIEKMEIMTRRGANPKQNTATGRIDDRGTRKLSRT